MKTTCFTAFALALIFNATAVYAQQVPQPIGFVNDYASLLQPKEFATLESELKQFTRTTTKDVVVVTVPYLGDKSMAQYAQEFSDGNIGKRGVVLLVALKERTGRIHIGSDVSSILTDEISRQIGEKTIAPLLSEGKMAEGIIAGTHAILRTLDANYAFVEEKQIENVVTVQTPAETQSEPISDNSNRTTFNQLLISFAVTVLLTALAIYIATPRIRQFKARRYVLNNKYKTANALVDATMLAQDVDVFQERRTELAVLRRKFSSINELTSASRVDWVGVQQNMSLVSNSLSSVMIKIELDISQALRTTFQG